MSSASEKPETTVEEYAIRVPKNSNKKHHVMRFNAVLSVDLLKWNQVKMERENNLKEFRGLDEEIPKYGAGSEFGREQKQEARRKKFGIITKKYRPEDQPWILKVGGKTGKKFKGIREGGVAENAAYYVFTHAPDGRIESFPLREWYNFQPIQRYKALSAEEAEQEFGRRNKVMNYFSLMLRKRLRNDEDGDMEDLEEERKGSSGKGGKGKGELKISDMDEWIDSDAGDENSDEEEGDKDKDDDEAKEKKGKGKKAAPKKKKRRDSNDEAFEESDDGDEEGREVDYISDSSDSELEQDEKVKESMKGVEEEDGLRKLLTSDEEDDEEKEREDEDGDEEKGDGDKKEDGDGDGKKGAADSDGEDDKKGASSSKKKKAKAVKKEVKKRDPSNILNDSSSYSSSDSSDTETKKKNPKGKETNSGNSSRAATPTRGAGGDAQMSSGASSSNATGDSNKRKGDSDNLASGSAKKPRIEGILSSGSSDSGITEEAVRRYLMRKPMTATELLQKFKSKKTGLSSEQLVNVMTQILKRINPIKQTIKGKMYLSIKG